VNGRLRLHDESGIAMVLVVFVGAFLALLGLTVIEIVRNESNRSAGQVQSGTAFQAAEAGIEDYIAKVVDDRLYYVHYVHPGEATRREPGGVTVAAGTDEVAWPYNLTWTYPNGFDHFQALPNGYEYSLQVFPPTDATGQMRIMAMGRKQSATTDTRVVETIIRPSSLADFYRVVNGDVNWGAGATTNGKIYANGDIDHDGIATANIYAEGQVSGSVDLQNGAKIYDRDDTNGNGQKDIRDQIKNPINFSSFVTSFVDVERAAQSTGNRYDDASKAAWRIHFRNDGMFEIRSCTKTSGKDIADTAPTCGTATVKPVPSNGAIYTAQSAVISNPPAAAGSVVDGRVTVASNDSIVVGNNISYETPGDDVLGLVAKNDVVIAKYVPSTMNWTAGVLAQSGTWETYTHDGSKTTMTFTGSSATNLGGDLTMFNTRIYGYDQRLLFLPPPWFPIVEDAYTVVLFRELPAN
jgi:hypothetical protein